MSTGVGAQLCHRALQYGVPQRRSQFHHRLQHKTALVHVYVRDDQLGRIDNRTCVEQDVDVERARPFVNFALAAEFLFNPLRLRKQLHRKHLGLCFQHQIQEARLVFNIHRIGFIHGRNALDGQAGCAQQG